MSSAVPQGDRTVDAQESRFQVAKHSDMGIAVMIGLRFADNQEWGLRLGNVHILVVPPCYVVDLLKFMNCVLNLRNVQIWAVPKSKGVYLWIVRNVIFRL